jgi:Flp pilus assembly protein TadD
VLFAQSVRDEPESYAAHFANGDWLYMNGMRGAGERETGEALRLYADDPRAYAWMGIRYAGVGHCQYAEPLLARAVELAPQFSEARGALARCFRRDGNWAAVRAVATAGVAQGIDVSYYRALLHLADTAGRGTPVAQGVSGGRGSG